MSTAAAMLTDDVTPEPEAVGECAQSPTAADAPGPLLLKREDALPVVTTDPLQRCQTTHHPPSYSDDY